MSAIKHVDNISFSSFLANYRRFSVPVFQRPYAWQPKHIAAFWENILSSDNHYYIGTIVAIPNKNNTALEIIDGQQRITTLLLFFVALRDYVKRETKFKNKENKIAGAEKFLWDLEDFGTEKEVRLRFNKRNLRNIFEVLVKGGDIPEKEELDDNQKKFLTSYILLKKQIKEYFKASSDMEAAFDSLTEKIVNLEFIIIICNSDSDAFQLFEGLNSTGLDLSVVDLLKNAILKAVDEHSNRSLVSLQEAEELWAGMESKFEARDIKLFSRFIRHQWIAKRGYISNSRLFDEIKSQELSSATSTKELIKYIKELRDDAQVYLSIRYAEGIPKVNSKLGRKSYKDKLKQQLDLFALLNVEQVYEVLLALVNRFIADKKYNPAPFLNHIETLWKFAFKTRFLSISPASYESVFADFCKEVSDNKNLNNKIQEFFAKLSKLVDGPEHKPEFIESFASDFRYSTRDTPLIANILEQIYLLSNPTIKINEPTIDHFLPQDPAEWGLKKDDIADYVHKIGNLTLLNRKSNQQLQNFGLNKKIKDIYVKNEFKENKKNLVNMQKQFKEDPEGAIQKRGEYLGEKAWGILRIKG